jgi:hypothetical protein
LLEEAAEAAEAEPSFSRLSESDRHAIEAKMGWKPAENGAAVEGEPEAADSWLARLRGWAAACFPGWSPSFQPRFVTGTAPAEPPRPAYLVAWADPISDRTAEVLFPTYFTSPDDPVTMTFRGGHRRLAKDMDGAMVELGGVQGRVGRDGVVSFRAQQFQEAGPAPVLIVENEGRRAEWPLRDKMPLGKDSPAECLGPSG